MKRVETGFDGLYVLELDLKRDERGYFARTYCQETFTSFGLETHFPQSGTAWNGKAGTVRGMHFQRLPFGEVKLIRCTRGAILDVVIDLRPQSKTYLQSYSIELDANNGKQLYVPPCFAHGYQTLTDDTEVLYLMSTVYIPDAATGVRWDDPSFNITWPRDITVISGRDKEWPLIGPDFQP